MSSSDFETEAVRPVAASCEGDALVVTLADGREMRAPLWWYPFLQRAPDEQRSAIELEFAGLWWPALDEGISVKSILLGWKAVGAVPPAQAVE